MQKSTKNKKRKQFKKHGTLKQMYPKVLIA